MIFDQKRSIFTNMIMQDAFLLLINRHLALIVIILTQMMRTIDTKFFYSPIVAALFFYRAAAMNHTNDAF